MNNKSKTAAGIILSLLGGIFWGFSGSCGQYLFTYHGVDSKWIVTVRMILTGIILLSVSFLKHKSKIIGVWKGKRNFICMAAFTLFVGTDNAHILNTSAATTPKIFLIIFI